MGDEMLVLFFFPFFPLKFYLIFAFGDLLFLSTQTGWWCVVLGKVRASNKSRQKKGVAQTPRG